MNYEDSCEIEVVEKNRIQQRQFQNSSIDIVNQEIGQQENFSSEPISYKDPIQFVHSDDVPTRLPLSLLQTNHDLRKSIVGELPGQLKSPTNSSQLDIPQLDQNLPSTKRSQDLWRTSNINEDLIDQSDDDNDIELSSYANDQPFTQQQQKTPVQINDDDDLEERILTEATPSRNGDTERNLMEPSYRLKQKLEWTTTEHGTPMNQYQQEMDTQENNSQDGGSPNNFDVNYNDNGPDFQFDKNHSIMINDQIDNNLEGKRISRSKTVQQTLPKKVSIIPPINIKKGKNADFIDEIRNGRQLKYIEDDVISGALETKKYFISTQQTMQTEGDNLNMQYTSRSALASERQTTKSNGRVNSTLFGSLNLSALRSARQIFPRSFSDLNGDESHRQKEIAQQKKQNYPFIPKLEFKKNCKTMLHNYNKSCMEGIFLKHLFCPQVSLKWYIAFMIAVDIFMAIADSMSIFTRGQLIVNADKGKERIGLTIAVVFFAIRILLYIPIGYYSLKLFMYDSRTGGKALYSLKLAVLLLFIIFNFVSLGFISEDGCSFIHIKLPRMNSLAGISNDKEHQVGEFNECSKATQSIEILGLLIYYILSCWIILSILYWIRRSRRDPSNDFLNLISLGQRGRTAIQLNHHKLRPLVKESQLQKRRMQHHVMVDESMQSDEIDDTPVRLSGAQKREHVNLKVAMKNLVDFKSDSHRNRIQKTRPGSTQSKRSRGKK